MNSIEFIITMSFIKQYNDYYINFDWMESLETWDIWVQIDKKIYHKIENFHYI